MGFWSRIKRSVSNTYNKIDLAVGGALPGGVTKIKTSDSSSTSQTTQPSTQTSTSAPSPQSSSGSSGGSSGSGGGVNIQIQPTARQTTPSGEVLTAREDSSGNIRVTSSTGQTQSVPVRSSGGNLTVQKVYQAPSSQYAGSGGATIHPGVSSVESYDYTGEPPERYNRPITSALSQSFRNSLNVGIIGTYGFGAYIKQAFYDPFEYVGQPKAYQEVGSNLNPTWRGTDFGYGLPDNQKQSVTPGDYQDTTSTTYYDIGEEEKFRVFSSAGVGYSGESAQVLPQRIQEDVVSDLKPVFQEKYNKIIESRFNTYQARVNSGELTVDQAQRLFEAESGDYLKQINADYQAQVGLEFESRYSKVSGKIAQIESFQSKIYQPPAYPIISGIGKGIETGAIIGATSFGGSGATIAASTYLGYKTYSNTVQYKSNYSQLSTGQKIIGGSGIALGALASAYTFNLGVNRFYGEWRNIIYNDLSKTPATIRGAEVLRTEEFRRYDIAALRRTGDRSALTAQRVDVYQTGSDSVGFYSKGITNTRIFDPQYERYITTSETFRVSGNIPNVQAGKLGYVGSNGLKVIPEDVYAGVGGAIYSSEKGLKSFNFIAGAKDEDQFFRVIGGANPQQSFSNFGNIKIISSNVRGRIDSTGKIFKLQEGSDVFYVQSSGARSSQQYLNSLYGSGVAGATQLSMQIQSSTLSELGKSSAQIGAGKVLGAQALSQVSNQRYSGQPQIAETRSNTRLSPIQLPTLSQMGLQEQSTKTRALGVSSGAVGALGLDQRNKLVVAQAQSQKLDQISGLKLKTSQVLAPIGQSFPGYFNPPAFKGGRTPIPVALFDINSGGLALPSNIIGGGSRVVRYTPSFSAIVFNIRGSSKRSGIETGINFRPITPGFQFNTGLDFNLNKLRRFLG